MKEILIKIEKLRACWDYNKMNTFLISLIMIYQIAI